MLWIQLANKVRVGKTKNNSPDQSIKEPLIISKCKGSCGCTVPECPKEPILPGESAVIKVNYDEKRVGSFNKSITITSNAKSTTKILKVKGKIIAAAKNTGAPIKKQTNLAPKAN